MNGFGVPDCPDCDRNLKHVHPIGEDAAAPAAIARLADSMFGDFVSVYSRRQAIEDGVLVDVSATAREAGFKYPVALTRALWDGYVRPGEGLEGHGQSESGRLWDVLTILRTAIRLHRGGPTLLFDVLFLMAEPGGAAARSRLVRLKSVIGPGDTPAPVITLMLPDED